MGFNTHSTRIPTQSDKDTKRDENKHFGYLMNYKFQSDKDCSSDEHLIDNGSFLSTPKDIKIHDLNPDFSVTRQHSRKGFKLLIGRKYCKQFSSRLH